MDELLEKSKEVPIDAELQQLLPTLRERIIALIVRARQGVSLIEVIHSYIKYRSNEKRIKNLNYLQDAIKTQNARKEEITQYQLILTEIEVWLRSIKLPTQEVQLPNQDEHNTVITIEQHNEQIKKLKEREKSLTDILEKCEALCEQADVSPLAKSLAEQLRITIQILRQQILMYTSRITILEQHLLQLREQPTSLTENTIDSSPMPEDEVAPNQYEVQTQTSFPLQPPVAETLDISVQTIQQRKPTENIVVTQTISDGHETIRFESVPNPTIPDTMEDVFVDAKYKQPGEATRTSELVLRNVPQSFETTFVEPDETTTEVIVDPDGTKRMIVRKLTRTRQQVIQQHQHQQFTTISSLVGSDNVPVTQSVTQVNLENQKLATTVSDAAGTKTILSKQAKGSLATGSSPDNLIIQETYETEPELEQFECPAENVTLQGVTMHEGDVAYVDRHDFKRLPTPEPLATEPGYEQSSIRAVVQQVTRRVIRRTRKIIKRIVIIDGKEHVTEEVVEEPEEIEISEEEIPNINVNIIHSRDGQIVSQQTHGEPIIQFPVDATTIVTETIKSPPSVTTTVVQEVHVKSSSPTDVPTQESQIQDKIKEDVSIEKEVEKEQKEKQEQEQEQNQEQERKTEEDVQVLELVSAPVDVCEPAPSVNVTHIEIPAEVIPAPTEEIHIEIVEKQPEITNITNIWPQEHHINRLEIEISEKSVDSTPVQHSPKDKQIAQDIWPTNENTGSPFQLEQYEYAAGVSPTEVHVAEDAPVTPIAPIDDTTKVDIVIESPESKIESIAIIKETETTNISEATKQIGEPEVTNVPASKPTIDIRAATQLFIDNELNTSDATTRTIKVSLPSKGSQSPGSVAVTMKVDPTEQTNLNVNIVEEGLSLPGQTEFDEKSTSDDSKRSRKKKKRKDKTPTPVPTPVEPASIDSSVQESIDLVIDDDNTISEKSEMPEIIATPEGTVRKEEEVTISPDESCVTIPEREGSVKVIEESVISSPSDSPKPIATELVITTEVVEAKQVEDAAQQTSPTQDETADRIISEKPVVELRSTQTSPEAIHAVVDISQQTSPEPVNPLKTEVIEIEVQTSPLPEIVGEKQPVEVTTEEIQTDDTTVPQTESIVQTVEVETKDQELQTTPKDSPKKVVEVVTSADVVPHVTETVITEIVRDLPVNVPVTHESTNTEEVTTIDTVTQTIAETPRDYDDSSIATSSSDQPYEIHIEASVTVPDDQSSSSALEESQPVVVEITKSFIVDESHPDGVKEVSTTYQEVPADKNDKKKKNKKKNKKAKDTGIDVNVTIDSKPTIDQTKSFLEAEQYSRHPIPAQANVVNIVAAEEPRPEPSAPQLEQVETIITETHELPDVEINIVTEIVQGTSAPSTPITDDLSIVSDTTDSTDSQHNKPQVVQLEITKKTEYCEPISVSTEEQIVPQTEITETVSTQPQLPIEQAIISAVATEEIPVHTSTTVSETVDTTAEEKTTAKPSLVQLSITKTTVYDNFTLLPGSEPETSHLEISSTEIPVEEKQQPPRKPKQRTTSSVTIEEVMSPTEEIDVPLTPGLDTAEQYERAPDTIWGSNLILNRPTSSTEAFIAAESAAVTPVTGPVTTTIVKPPVVAEWHHTNDAITDRIRNTNNVRNARLSNVLHLATLSEVVTEEPVESRIEAIEQNLNALQQSITRRDTVVIQKTVITIIETISTWLETIEYRVYLNRQNSSEGPSEDKVQDFKNLKTELENIENSVSQLTSNLETVNDLVPPADKKRMTTCFNNLKDQVHAIETITKENSEQAESDLKRLNEYITIVHTITIYITNLKQKFENIVSQDDVPINRKLEQLDELENENRQQVRDISKAIQTARALMRDFPSNRLPQDVYNTYKESRSLENAIIEERSKLLQLLSLAEEYEQTLHEFEQITLLADALVEQPINVNTLEELQQEMQKHRKFFINLSHCKAILESLEENLDPDSRVKHAELHKMLYDRATSILEKAAERAQKISLAASRWTVLERGMRDEGQWLQVAQHRVPTDLSEVTSADYDRYITLYQSLSSDIANHHAKTLQLTKIAAQLQELVNAPNLEEENNDSLAILSKLREEVTLYLRRLYSFKETWTLYEILTDRLEIWIKEAERDLAGFEVPKDLRTQPIENMRQFWEIKAHYEVNNNIRNDVSNQFEKAVEILPIADEVLQRQFHGQLENRWHAVSKKINDIQNAIVNSLSDQELPINDKLALLQRELEEIQLNISSNRTVIKNEEELNLYIQRIQVLKSRIGIICNELGKIGLLPSSEPEQIGELFALSHRINGQVAEELENATILRDRLIAIQQGISRVQKNQQNNNVILDVCETQEKLGSEQIEVAIIECQDVKEELAAQWQEIMRLRQLLHALPMRLRVSVSPVKLERDLSQLQDDHALLETRCGHILGLLRSRLQLWRRFERQLEIVQQSISETDYMVELLKVNGQVDYERLKKATERLEVSH